MRGPRRHFTHSKLMDWVAFDRAVKECEQFGREEPTAHWRVRDAIHAQVCAAGYNKARAAFTQAFHDERLDAALLMMPLVGFLPVEDPRIQKTITAIRREQMAGGFVQRYATDPDVDGLPPGEAAFLPCSF